MVCGLPGVGKSAVIGYILSETGRSEKTSRHELTGQERIDVATLLDDIERSTGHSGNRQDPLGRLEAALETPVGKPVTVLVDNAKALVDPATNRFYDLRLEEALVVLAGRRRRAVKVILVLERPPGRSGSAHWPVGAESVFVGGLSEVDFQQYVEMLADRGRIDLSQVDLQGLYEVTTGVPRLTELFCTAPDLLRSGRTAAALIRRLNDVPPDSREAVLATEVVGSLDADQRHVVSALVAYGAPVTEDQFEVLSDNNDLIVC